VSALHEGAILYLHGGAFCLGNARSHRSVTTRLAAAAGLPVWVPEYRLAPEHPHPAGLQDARSCWRAMRDAGYPAERIVVAGDSAGGALALALTLSLRDDGENLPAGLVLLSPQVDLTESGDSFVVNAGVDGMLPTSLMSSNRLYAGGADLSDPLVSPLFGDVANFPPTFLLTGTRDLFLSNTVRMHRRLVSAGVPADLHVFEAMPHGGFGGSPEDREAAHCMTRFVRDRLSAR